MGVATSEAGRCWDCKHWGPEGHVTGLKECHKIRDMEDMREVTLTTAVTRGFFGELSELLTQAGFGCVLHEPREENHEQAL